MVKSKLEDKTIRFFTRGIIYVLITSVIFVFILLVWRTKMKFSNDDAHRIQHLQIVERRIVELWQPINILGELSGALPPNLEALETDFNSYKNPRDPKTRATYEYHPVDGNTYMLCAVFDQSSTEPHSNGEYEYRKLFPLKVGGDIWVHSEGLHCFTRTIFPTNSVYND